MASMASANAGPGDCAVAPCDVWAGTIMHSMQTLLTGTNWSAHSDLVYWTNCRFVVLMPESDRRSGNAQPEVDCCSPLLASLPYEGSYDTPVPEFYVLISGPIMWTAATACSCSVYVAKTTGTLTYGASHRPNLHLAGPAAWCLAAVCWPGAPVTLTTSDRRC